MKKYLSFTLLFSIVLSLLLTPFEAGATDDYISIDDMPSSTRITVKDFEAYENGDNYYDLAEVTPDGNLDTDIGSYTVRGPKSDQLIPTSSCNYSARLEIVNDPDDAENKVLRVSPFIGFMPITQALQDKINSEGVTITVLKKDGSAATNPSTVKAIEMTGYKSDGTEAQYYVYVWDGSYMGWYHKESDKVGKQPSSSTVLDRGERYFAFDGKPVALSPSNAIVDMKLRDANMSPITDGDGNYLGVYSMGFRYKTEGKTRPNIKLNGWKSNDEYSPGDCVELYLSNSKINMYRNAFYIDDKNTLFFQKSADAAYVGKTADTTGVVLASDRDNKLVSLAGTESWHDILITADLENSKGRVYFDGKPLFFGIDTNSDNTIDLYTSEIQYKKQASTNYLPYFYIAGHNNNIYIGDDFYIDDLTTKYDAESITLEVNWDKISNGQKIHDVTRNLTLPSSIVFAGNNYDVAWTSDSTLITNEGKVTRPDKDTLVTLTATVGRKTVTHRVTVSGTDGTYNINTADGQITYQQNFDDYSINPGDALASIPGFETVNDAAKSGNRNVYFKALLDTASTALETSNRVLGATGKQMLRYFTDEQYDYLNTSGLTKTMNNTSYKVMDCPALPSDYYIGFKVGASRNTIMYWFKKAQDGSIDALGTNSTNYWFNVEDGANYGKPYVYNEAGKTNLLNPASSDVQASEAVFPKPTNTDGLVNGMYTISFDYAYPDNGNIYNSSDQVCFSVEGCEFMVGQSGIINYATAYVVTDDNNTTSPVTGYAAYVAKDPSVTNGPVTDLTLLKTASFHNDKEYHNILIRMNLTEGTYQICYDSRPLFFRASSPSNVYSSTLAIKDLSQIPTVSYKNMRHNTFEGHIPMIDNIVIKYSPQNLTDEEKAQIILDSITLPYVNTPVLSSDIVLDKNESEKVGWSFDGSGILSLDPTNPLIARLNAPVGFGTANAVITATATYNSVTKTKDFNLEVRKNTPYVVNSVVMTKEGKRVYTPVSGAVLEKVNVTKHQNKTASIFVSIYDSNGSLKKTYTKEIPENGDVSINHTFSEGETYKTFVFDEILRPCSYTFNPISEAKDTVKIFMIGDSIAQTYPSSSLLRGVGQMLGNEFTENIVVDNTQSVSGRSCKYSLSEDRLNYVLDNATAGDYLFIQLGHNDEKTEEYYGSTPEEFEILLLQMVNAAKDKGIIPVLLSPVTRPQFTEEHVVYNSHAKYAAVMQKISDEYGIPYIDVNQKTIDSLGKLGISYRDIYFNANDTHLVEAGAIWVADIIANGIKEIELPIAKYVK